MTRRLHLLLALLATSLLLACPPAGGDDDDSAGDDDDATGDDDDATGDDDDATGDDDDATGDDDDATGDDDDSAGDDDDATDAFMPPGSAQWNFQGDTTWTQNTCNLTQTPSAGPLVLTTQDYENWTFGAGGTPFLTTCTVTGMTLTCDDFVMPAAVFENEVVADQLVTLTATFSSETEMTLTQVREYGCTSLASDCGEAASMAGVDALPCTVESEDTLLVTGT